MKKRFNKKVLRILLITLGILIILSLSAFFIWTQNTYPAIDVPQLEIEEEQTLEDGWYIYEAEDADKGLILYPGAKVEPEAYAYLSQELSQHNITVAIPSFSLNLPILNISKADEIIEKDDQIDWYIGGHSMGGVAAAMYADRYLDRIKGLILLGAYTSSNDTLSESDLPVLSISGSEDGLSTSQEIQKYSSNLPPTTKFIEIPGGNHAYFGVYGSQSGDNAAQITVEEQQTIIIDSILNWLGDVDGTSQDGT